MYMDEHEIRGSGGRMDGEVLRLLSQERGHSHSGMTAPYPAVPHRGCDGLPRNGTSCVGESGRCRGGIQPRRETGAGGGGGVGIGGAGGCTGSGVGSNMGGMTGNGCGCDCDGGGNVAIGNTYPCCENGVTERSLAMVYTPVQLWRNMHDPSTALVRGTLFRELDMPFCGVRRRNEGGHGHGC